MKRSGLLVISFLLIALLSACASLIPDQQINDVFGFDGVVIEMTVSSVGTTSDGIAPQAGEVVAAGSTSYEVDVSDIDLPFNPTPTSVLEGMSPQWIRLFRPTPGADLPTTLSLDSASFDASFTDGNATFTETVSAPFSPSALFERDDASCNINRCNYLPVEDNSLILDLDSNDIAAILAILGSAFEPKLAGADAMLAFSDDPLLAGVTQAELKVDASGGTISFK